MISSSLEKTNNHFITQGIRVISKLVEKACYKLCVYYIKIYYSNEKYPIKG